VKRGWFELYNAGDSDIDWAALRIATIEAPSRSGGSRASSSSRGIPLIWASGETRGIPTMSCTRNYTLMERDALFLTDGIRATLSTRSRNHRSVDHSYGVS